MRMIVALSACLTLFGIAGLTTGMVPGLAGKALAQANQSTPPSGDQGQHECERRKETPTS